MATTVDTNDAGRAAAEQPLVTPRTLDHANLHVRDVPASLRFYREVLGVQDYSVLGQDEAGRPTFVDLHIGDQEVFLMERPDYRPPAERNERGLNHICLTIDATDPDQLQANLRARGVSIRGTRAGRSRDGRRTFSVYIDDPDGHGVELEQVVA